MTNAQKQKGLEAGFGTLLVYMLAETIRTSMKRNLFKDFPRLMKKEPWFSFTIKDYYANLVLIAFWMLYKERNPWARAAWLTSFGTLGSLGTLAYALWKIVKASPRQPVERSLLYAR